MCERTLTLGQPVRKGNEKVEAPKCSLRRMVRPAFGLMVAMGQFGPCLEPEGWPRVIDCLLRALSAFPLTLFALRDLVNVMRSNSVICATPDGKGGQHVE